jgi:mono/diheme cytochrome c family protein
VRDKTRTPEWNRGAYLVEGLGHCGACHSPKNVLGAVKKDDRFHGGMGEGWFATKLTPHATEGLGSWSIEEIVEYLKTGANEHARAYGPMAEVVTNSTAHLSNQDLRAMAFYLKDLPRDGDREQQASNDRQVLSRGERLYVDQCAGCHMENGEGVKGVFPPIRNNAAVHAQDPHSLVRLVLEGAASVKTRAKPEGFAMPDFADKLSDADIADLLTYIRATFGNRATAVAAATVAEVRHEKHKS